MIILFNRQSLAEKILDYTDFQESDKNIQIILNEIKQMQFGDFTDRYFYEQLCFIFYGTKDKLVLPKSEIFEKKDVANTETKVNDVFYMDIARFIISNFEIFRIKNFEISPLFDYDNEKHSEIIYDGLTNCPTIAKCLANIYQNLKEKEKENIENEL